MDRRLLITAIFISAILTSLIVGMQAVGVAKAQVSANVTINPDGSITGTGIQRNGDVYTLTGNISGGIEVEKSYVVIDGAGFTIEGNSQYVRGIDLSNGVGQDPTHPMITNVTVMNFKIMNCYYAIDNSNSGNNTFFANYISDCDTGFWITGSSNNTLKYNTVKDCVTGISINYAGFNIITENNIINNSVLVWLSTEPFVDGNYWSDYQSRYPYAKEIEKSGLPNTVWDTPYNYGESLGNFTDNHPLIEPIVVPASLNPSYSPSPSLTSSLIPTALPTQPPTTEPTQAWTDFVDGPNLLSLLIGIVIILAIGTLGAIIYFRGARKRIDGRFFKEGHR